MVGSNADYEDNIEAIMMTTMNMLNVFWMFSICFCHIVGSEFTWLGQIIQSWTYGSTQNILLQQFLEENKYWLKFSQQEKHWCELLSERKILVWTFASTCNLSTTFCCNALQWLIDTALLLLSSTAILIFHCQTIRYEPTGVLKILHMQKLDSKALNGIFS